ncbi:hypothetical protein OKW38_000186 [Paraburkholderia sp. MM5496-R1]
MAVEDLTDDEWALIEQLFYEEPTQSAPRTTHRSSRGSQRRVMAAVDGQELQRVAGPLPLVADLPSPFRPMAGRWHAR